MHMNVPRALQYKRNALIECMSNDTYAHGAITKPEDQGTNIAHKVGTTPVRPDKHSNAVRWLLYSTIATKEIFVDTSAALPTEHYQQESHNIR